MTFNSIQFSRVKKLIYLIAIEIVNILTLLVEGRENILFDLAFYEIWQGL